MRLEIVKDPFKVRDRFFVYSGRSPFPALSPFHPEFHGRSVQSFQGLSDFYLSKKHLILVRAIQMVCCILKQLFTSVSMKIHHVRAANQRAGKALQTGLVFLYKFFL